MSLLKKVPIREVLPLKSYIHAYLQSTKEIDRSSGAMAFLASLDAISQVCPLVAENIVKELTAQRTSLKMIASENYSSLAVQLAMGNFLTDKYAEGFAHHRFYAGCEQIDAIEDEASRTAKALFSAEHAYVQPHSGADANLLAFWAILTKRVQIKELEKIGKKSLDECTKDEFEIIRNALVNQKLLGMSLNSGGHLTHGYRHNISSRIFNAAFYDVDSKTGLLDYDQIAAIAKKEKPAILLAGYSAYPRAINFATLRQIAEDVGATFMVDMAHFAGLVAGKVFVGEFDPVPFADVVTSTTHKTLRGPRGGLILCKEEFAHFVNKGCPMVQGGPLPHVLAAKAVAFTEALQPSFVTYAHAVVRNAKALAEELMRQGATVLTKGTDNHIVLVDVSSYGLTGKQAELVLRQSGITCNRNAIPFDSNGPWLTSGIRLGTPALTTRGMGPDAMKEIASILVNVLRNAHGVVEDDFERSKSNAYVDAGVLAESINQIQNILKSYPLYPEILTL